MEYGEIIESRSYVVVTDCKLLDFRFDRLVHKISQNGVSLRARVCRVVCKSVFSSVFRMVYKRGRCEVCAPFIEADISENFGGT